MTRYTIYARSYAVLARLPWWCIVWLSRAIAVLLYAVIRYRRTVVEDNIKQCLPELTEQQRRDVAWGFYAHLTHQFLSTPRIIASSPEEICREHIAIKGVEDVAQQLAKSGKRVAIIMMGHIGNWEIFSAASHYFAAQGLQMEQLYRPLKDRDLDNVQRQLRTRHGAIATPKAAVGRRMIALMRGAEERPVCMAFIADQTPAPHLVGEWILFLNRMTAFLDGAERLARKYDLPVYYFDITRVTDQRYSGQLKLLAPSGAETEQGEITRRFARELEQTIRRDPAIWLWSHRRWKHPQPNHTP